MSYSAHPSPPLKDIVAEYILLGQYCRWNVASAWPCTVHWSIICTSEPALLSGSKISTLAPLVFGHGLLGVVGTGLITVRYLSQAVPWRTLQVEVSKASSQSSWGTSSNSELVKEIPEDLSSTTTASVWSTSYTTQTHLFLTSDSLHSATASPGFWLTMTTSKLIKGGLMGGATVPTAFSSKRYPTGSLECQACYFLLLLHSANPKSWWISGAIIPAIMVTPIYEVKKEGANGSQDWVSISCLTLLFSLGQILPSS